MKNSVNMNKNGLIRTVLILIVAVIILSYFGITFTDIAENRYVQWVIDLIVNFFQG